MSIPDVGGQCVWRRERSWRELHCRERPIDSPRSVCSTPWGSVSKDRELEVTYVCAGDAGWRGTAAVGRQPQRRAARSQGCLWLCLWRLAAALPVDPTMHDRSATSMHAAGCWLAIGGRPFVACTCTRERYKLFHSEKRPQRGHGSSVPPPRRAAGRARRHRRMQCGSRTSRHAGCRRHVSTLSSTHARWHGRPNRKASPIRAHCH